MANQADKDRMFEHIINIIPDAKTTEMLFIYISAFILVIFVSSSKACFIRCDLGACRNLLLQSHLSLQNVPVLAMAFTFLLHFPARKISFNISTTFSWTILQERALCRPNGFSAIWFGFLSGFPPPGGLKIPFLGLVCNTS